MKVMCVVVMLLVCASASAGPTMGVEFQYTSSGCFPSAPVGVEEDVPQCPLPQVVRWNFEQDVLRVEFSVRANCCPQNDRFVVESWGSADSLVIAVADTAADGCRCSCPYLLTVEYSRLGGDTYTVSAEAWGDYELFAPTIVERGSAGESEPLESIYKRFRARGAQHEAP